MAFRSFFPSLRFMHRLLSGNEPFQESSFFLKQVEASPLFQSGQSLRSLSSLVTHAVDCSGAQPLNSERTFVSLVDSSSSLSQFSSFCHQPQSRSYSTDTNDEDLAKEGEQPPQKGGTGSSGDETGLPLIQRCKNVLVSNWKGQLSTINPGAAEGQRNAVRSTFISYAVLDGRPIIWLPRHDEHEMNIIGDNRASLMAGHTDPPALVQAVQKGCKRLPPLAVILGEVSEIDPSEAEYWRKRVRKLSARALSAVERAGPKAKALLDTVGPTADARQKALEAMAGASELRAYRLEPKEWTYMDVAGERKSGTAEEFQGALTDPLALVSVPLIDALNRDQGTRKRLILFAAAYMQVEARDAYVLSIDRWGFTCLVQRSISIDPAEIGTPVTLETGSNMGKNEGEWGEFRFSFSHEVRDAEGFCATFEAMEADVIRHYKEQTEKDSENVKA
ncbi:hypothetical protein KFL_000950010 [Klebsormidium nitens]|uniref:Uncharacterized protein n=1 Tax=Klebsormidium nitens TaxID=105231 RepID=A0A1Y1HZH9_KLENI|nr:hypothetical protein KFL_000950010 [Klebsormidium nitens]|eukprot:GAQ81926.1 hypothetical protein KFL_000950010 [Klebsormidium nitens]